MGHAAHFLERLSRIEHRGQLDLALALYRDAGLVRHVLSRAKFPEGAERVALCLGPGVGPYVIVTREGHFVTCLAEGMVAKLPIVARAHLDALARESAEIRRRLDLAEEIAPDARGTHRLLVRLFEAGPYLSREELLALSAIVPLQSQSCLVTLHEAALRLVKDRAAYLRLAALAPERLSSEQSEALAQGWGLAWAHGHLAVLSAMSERELVERVIANAEPNYDAVATFSAVSHLGIMGVSLRGAWAVAKVGKPLLPLMKQRYAAADNHQRVMEATLGLAALGARHKSMRAEVIKALYAEPAEEAPEPMGAAAKLAWIKAHFTPIVQPGIEAPQEAAQESLELGRRHCVQLGARAPKGSPFRFQGLEEVPEELALAGAACGPFEAALSGGPGLHLMPLVGLLARAEPEQLYFPRAFLEACQPQPDPSDIQGVIERHWARHDTRQLKEEKTPAPNARCPCGSGKKYKRCCGNAG